jgi:hypothetical protein
MNPLETSGLPYNGPSFRCRSRVLFWGAIFAGAVAALALQILLMMLGAGLGFAIYNPVSNDNPVADFGAGAAVIQGLAAVVSLWAGGWIAGRFTGRAGLKVGALHGFMVWCLATATVIVAVSGGAGWALGGLSKIVGGGLSMAGQPAAAAVGGAADLAKEAAGRSQDMLKSFIDESVSNRRPDQNAGDTIRAKRELGFAITQFFTADASTAENRQALVTALARSRGISETDAGKIVDEWSASYEKLKSALDSAKEKAEARARELAEKTAKALSILSFCSFVAFLIGAVFAILGGKHGGACGYRRTDIPVDAPVA